MIIVHDIYHLTAGGLNEFEDAYWDGSSHASGQVEGIEPLWLLTQRIGVEGEIAVALTAARSGADLGAYTRWQAESGFVRDLADRLSCTHERKTLLAAPWSPLGSWDEVQAISESSAGDNGPRVFMEDTGWPYAALSAYVDFQRREYWEPLQQWAATGGLLKLWGFFLIAYGTGHHPEAIFLQEVLDLRALERLVGEPEEYDPETFPGSYMVHGLDYRDQWRSRLLVLSHPRRSTHV